MVAKSLNDGPCEILIDHSPPPETWLPVRSERDKVALIVQPGEPSSLGEHLAAGLAKSVQFALPDGEEAKSLQTVEEIYRVLSNFGVGRHDTVVGIGGGAATDVAGFVAATWLRGVESVLVPTTLLGAVDAAIGGKTGVNFEGKNQIGAFWRPSRVVIDLDVLASLPPVVARQGWAETVKAGFIADTGLLDLIEVGGVDTDLEEAVPRAIAVKLAVVSKDFTEAGGRAVLNYGHTIGHALETATSLPHGDAVGLGMTAAAAVAERLVGFEHRSRHNQLIARLGLPTTAPPVDLDQVRMLMQLDKKRGVGNLRMVLLRQFGEPVVENVTPDDIETGLAAVGLL